ncbi:MAG: transcriptional regulator, partial [Candidatus Microthrix parvicella]
MTAKQPPTIDQIAALSVLGEPSRRALYDYIVLAGDWVGRDAAADAAGIQRGVAAHHLDRLADEGLLDVDYQRLTGRTGPGAGRPAKVYRRSALEFDIALPPRDYELAGRLLADAVVDAQSSGGDISE